MGCHKFFKSTFFFVLSFAVLLQAQAQSAIAGDCINNMMQQTPVAGLSVAVVKDNQIIYTHSFGYKNIYAFVGMQPGISAQAYQQFLLYLE